MHITRVTRVLWVSISPKKKKTSNSCRSQYYHRWHYFCVQLWFPFSHCVFDFSAFLFLAQFIFISCFHSVLFCLVSVLVYTFCVSAFFVWTLYQHVCFSIYEKCCWRKHQISTYIYHSFREASYRFCSLYHPALLGERAGERARARTSNKRVEGRTAREYNEWQQNYRVHRFYYDYYHCWRKLDMTSSH